MLKFQIEYSKIRDDPVKASKEIESIFTALETNEIGEITFSGKNQ